MKQLIWPVVLFLAGAVFADEAKPAPVSPLAPLESLVGGTWIASLPVPKDQSPLVTVRYERKK